MANKVQYVGQVNGAHETVRLMPCAAALNAPIAKLTRFGRTITTFRPGPTALKKIRKNQGSVQITERQMQYASDVGCGKDRLGLAGGGSRARKKIRKAQKTAQDGVENVKRANAKAGHHFFDKDTLRFFKSRTGDKLYARGKCVFFTTSEKGPDGERRHSVRKTCDGGGRIQTVGKFQAYKTKKAAETAASRQGAPVKLGRAAGTKGLRGGSLSKYSRYASSHKDYAGRVDVREVKLDRGGYDRRGQYYGRTEEKLYEFDARTGEMGDRFRARSRGEALTMVSEAFPEAKVVGKKK